MPKEAGSHLLHKEPTTVRRLQLSQTGGGRNLRFFEGIRDLLTNGMLPAYRILPMTVRASIVGASDDTLPTVDAFHAGDTA